MTKPQLIAKLAGIVVNNWIVTGDQPESNRKKNERSMRRVYNEVTRECIEGMLAQITVL